MKKFLICMSILFTVTDACAFPCFRAMRPGGSGVIRNRVHPHTKHVHKATPKLSYPLHTYLPFYFMVIHQGNLRKNELEEKKRLEKIIDDYNKKYMGK